MRILITGASGMLGATLVYEWRDRHDVLAVCGKNPIKHNNVTTIALESDVSGREFRYFLYDFSPDWVVHCAAKTDHNRCDAFPFDAWKTNAEATGMIARACREHGVKMLYISTDAVFGAEQKLQYDVYDTPKPTSNYGKSKLCGEAYVRYHCPDHIISRTCIYGWNGSITQKESLAEFGIRHFDIGASVKGWANVVFSPLFTGDLAGNLMTLMETRGSLGTHHLASADAMSKHNFLCLVARVFGYDENLVIPVERERGETLKLDARKFANRLVVDIPTIEQGLFSMRRWGEKNLQAYREMCS